MATDGKPEKAQRVFVLADTHNRLPESVKRMARDADEIWHLGDVCAETILDELQTVGPRLRLSAEIAIAISNGLWLSILCAAD
jgi:predicted phosphodiesterase